MIKQKITQNLINALGWKTSKKFIVIESDDWGSIRTSNKQSYEYFKKLGYEVDKCPYNRFDALESNDDLQFLYEVLNSVKDSQGNPAIVTANNIVANPNFDKIKENDFQSYFYEPFYETLKRYPKHDQVESLYFEGISRKVFKPQFHGREHLNVNRWFEHLRNGNDILRTAFEQNMFTVQKEGSISGMKNYLDSFGTFYSEETEGLTDILTSGLKIFKDYWGYESKSFIAPCYVWSSKIEEVLFNNNVRFLQGTHVQKQPVKNRLAFDKKYHFTGQKNRIGQVYLVRNSFFEPTSNTYIDWVAKCLDEIKNSFKWGVPAIIGSHRVNYIGYIDSRNRDRNLKLLSKLLNKIILLYPDVEFISSDQLGEVITAKPQ